MASWIKSVSIDCQDSLVVARFWAAAISGEVDDDATTEKAFVEAAGWGGPSLWCTRVPEPKTVKNRVHFDLRAGGPIADEVARLTALGATVLRESPGLVVMHDPEGNEFCVE